MGDGLRRLVGFINANHGIGDKNQLSRLVAERFSLRADRSVFYCADFAIRFSSAAQPSFSNTVLSLSNLKKLDDRPFVVCLVTPAVNHCFLANTTLLKKISHSSQTLRENNIKGSFNGSDILRDLEGIANITDNFERLFQIHAAIGFDGNLPRLVEATNNISPSGVKLLVSPEAKKTILAAPRRAMEFVASSEAAQLKRELDRNVERHQAEILLASRIDNVKVRGQMIEYLIAGEDEPLRRQLISALKAGQTVLPQLKLENELGDHRRIFDGYHVETDVKSKLLTLDSNPKAYNLDKLLQFLSVEKSVFLFYFVGIEPDKKRVDTVLVSVFQQKLLGSTLVLRHWAGRNSRGVTQFEGKTINSLILDPERAIDEASSIAFLEKILAL